jgi:hypothetical protein
MYPTLKMNNISKSSAFRTFPGSLPFPWRTIFSGDAAEHARTVMELLREQNELLDTSRAFSQSELKVYETRAEQVSELIRLLTEERPEEH